MRFQGSAHSSSVLEVQPGARHDDEIEGSQSELVGTEAFAHGTLYSVPRHRATCRLSRDRQPEAWTIKRVWRGKHGETGVAGLQRPGKDALEFALMLKPRMPRKAVRRGAARQ